MVKALVITNNVKFIQKLLEELKFYELNVSIDEISTNKNETEQILDSTNYNMIFIDKSMVEINTKELSRSYRKKIILLSYQEEKNMMSLNALNNIIDLMKIYDTEKIKEKI